MTPTKMRLLFGAAVVAIVALFAATDVTAQVQVPLLDGIPFVRQCTDSRNLFNVTAGAGGDAAAVFPRLITSESPNNGSECPGGPPCLGWDYRWKATSNLEAKYGFNELLVSAATQVTVLGCGAGCHAHTANPEAAEHFLGFDVAGGRDFSATYYTPVGIGPGTMTAKFSANTTGRGKKERERGTCLIAGASEVGQEQALPTTLSVFETVKCDDAGNTCTLERKVDIFGCQIDDQINLGADCDACPSPFTIDPNESFKVETGGGPVEATAVSCQLRFVQTGASFRYCYPNSVGSMTCITFP